MQELCDIISALLENLESTPGVLEVGGQEEEKGALSVSDDCPRPHLPWSDGQGPSQALTPGTQHLPP